MDIKRDIVRLGKDLFLPVTVPMCALGRVMNKYRKTSAVIAVILLALIATAFILKTKASCDGVVKSYKATDKFFHSYDAIWFGVIWIGTAAALRFRRQRNELRAKELRSPRGGEAHGTYGIGNYYAKNQEALTKQLDGHPTRDDYGVGWD